MSWPVRILILAALIAGVVWFDHSRSQRPQRVQVAGENGVLLLGNGTDIETLDPQMATGQPEHHVITTIFEGLVAPAADDPDKDAPGVAASWEHRDFITWTFKLQPEARWSDGTPITSQDFLYAWQRILSPDLGSDYAPMLYLMKGAEAFHKGETKDFSTVGAKALDEKTLEIVLEGPAPYFPGMLKHYTWFPVPRQAIEKFGTMTQRDTAWARPGNIVCNGPFMLKDWRINHFIAVEKNPHYWDAAKTSLKEIHFFPIDNAESEERVFLDGQLHVTNTAPLAKVPFYREKKPPYFKQALEMTTEFQRINVTRPPLDNPKFRMALSLGFDRAALVDQVIRSGHLPATGLVPPGTHPDYAPLKKLRFDLAEARRLLAEAGFPEGRGLRKLDLLTNSSGTARTVAEFFQESWRKNLGIEITIRQQEWQVYLDSMRKLDYDIGRAGWVGDYADPFTFLGIFRTGDGNNNTGWGNARFDEMLLAATREMDLAKRLDLMKQGEELLIAESPIIPVFWRMNSHLERLEVRGWLPSMNSHRCYKAISLGPFEPLPKVP
jgi:oligopeptide transport system substrate-binding protein